MSVGNPLFIWAKQNRYEPQEKPKRETQGVWMVRESVASCFFLIEKIRTGERTREPEKVRKHKI